MKIDIGKEIDVKFKEPDWLHHFGHGLYPKMHKFYCKEKDVAKMIGLFRDIADAIEKEIV